MEDSQTTSANLNNCNHCNSCVYKQHLRCAPREVRQADLMIIGESPMAHEVRSSKLFDSKGGEMLKQTLRKVGLPEGIINKSVHFTNALNCVAEVIKGKQTIDKEAAKQCRLRLIDEIKQVQPRLVMLFGNTALQVATGIFNAKISEYQGRVTEVVDVPGVKFIPCFHPAKLMYNPGDYKVFSQIFTYAASVFKDDKVLDAGATEFIAIRTLEELQKSYHYLKEHQIVYLGCDTETTGLNPREEGSRILTLGISYAKNKAFVYHEDIIPHMSQLLSDKRFQRIWHNAQFDLNWLDHKGIAALGEHDVMLLHYSTNETSGTHDLEQLAQLMLGAEAYKSTANQFIKSKEGFGSAPEEVLFERVAVDADYTLQLFHRLYPLVQNDSNLKKLYNDILIPASGCLQQISKQGMLLDVPYLKKRKDAYDIQIEQTIKTIQEEVGPFWNPEIYKAQTEAKTAPEVFNPKSPKQLSWLIFDRIKLKPTKMKKRSTDMDVLESIQNPPQFVKSIVELRHIQKELSTYIEGNLDRKDIENRVHSNFSLHITATGRLSSKNPNIQNIPSLRKDVRRAFIVPNGYKIMESDYKGAELRVLAHCSGVGALGRALMEGRDLHDDLSVRFWGPDFTKSQRMQAKTVNFGVPYGREAFSIAQEFNMSNEEAQGLIDEWFKLYPEAASYLNQCAADAAAGKPLVTPFGRYRRFGLITPDTLHGIQNEAKNFRIQSIASDCTLISAIRIQPQIQKLGAHIINLVHDSIVTEVPDDEATIREVAKIIQFEMMDTPVRELGSIIPFGIDIEMGTNWADLKTYNIGGI